MAQGPLGQTWRAHQYDQSRDRDDSAGKDELTGPRGGEHRRMIEGSAAGRAWTPDEVGAVATLLMGPDGGFISGIDFLMDGGVTAAYW